MFLLFAGVEDGPAHERAADEVTGNTRLGSYHASSVDALQAMGV